MNSYWSACGLGLCFHLAVPIPHQSLRLNLKHYWQTGSPQFFDSDDVSLSSLSTTIFSATDVQLITRIYELAGLLMKIFAF